MGLLEFEHRKSQFEVLGVGLGVDELHALFLTAVQVNNLIVSQLGRFVKRESGKPRLFFRLSLRDTRLVAALPGLSL